jgi:hypothetical protein
MYNNLIKISNTVINYGIKENLKVENGIVVRGEGGKLVKTKYKHFTIFIDLTFPLIKVSHTVNNYGDRLILQGVEIISR